VGHAYLKESGMTAPESAPSAPETDTGAPADSTTTGQPATDRDVTDVAALNAENAKWRRQLRDAQAENEKLKAAHATDAEKAIAAARVEGATEYQLKWQRALTETAALAVLAERGCPAAEPALKALDLSDIDVDANGQFDRNQVAAKVDDLMRRYPVFAASGAAPSLPPLSGDSQHRVTSADQVRPSGKLSDAETERLLRYGLGHNA
jgi:hypothetical protein